MTALTFVIPGQGLAQEQNPQPGIHAVLTAEAFSRALTAALRQFEQAARRANPDQGPTLKASLLRAAFTNAEVPIAFVRRFGERPAAMVTFDDLSAADANSSMAPILRGALGCEQLDSSCAQRLDREFRDLLEPTARALFAAQTLFTELDECLQAGRCDAASPEDQRLLHEAETFVGQTDLPQVFRALAVAQANRMRLPGAIECVRTVPLDLRDCRDPITAREERDASRNRDHGSRIPGPSLAIGNGTVNDEGDIPPDAIFLPPIEKELPPNPEPDPSFTPPAPEDPCQAFGPGCGDPGDLVAAIDPKCPPGSEFKEPGCGPTEGGGGGTPRDMGPMGPIEGVGRGGGEVGAGRVRPGGGVGRGIGEPGGGGGSEPSRTPPSSAPSAPGLVTIEAGLPPSVPSAVPKISDLAARFQTTEADLLRNVLQNGQRFVDTTNNSVNVFLQRPDSAGFIRVTLDPSQERVISAGLVRERNVANSIASGRFVPLE